MLLVWTALVAARVPARAEEWSRYETIMWHNLGPTQVAALPSLHVTAVMMIGMREGFDAAELARRAAALRQAGLGTYVENIATDFYAAYHRWQPGRSVTEAFEQAKVRHARDPADVAAFLRQPSLSDPIALAAITARLGAHVRALADHLPLFFSLGDETGIADLAVAWDFDFSPASLAGMRDWLRGEYGTLAALNAEWGTNFPAWNDVTPLTTDAALRRGDDNFAAWADFKAWMDVAFARAVAAGAAAVHAGDPAARAAIEGTQQPGWGGYDYSLLAPTVDVMEISASETTRALAQTFNPRLVTLNTTSGGDARAVHAIWRAALNGSRGTVIWDPDGTFVAAAGTPGANGRAMAAVFAALQGPLGERLRAATADPDDVAALYSPASFRTHWLLDRRADKRDWAARDAETELEDSPWRDALEAVSASLQHLGLRPRYVSDAQLAAGALRTGGLRALILPQAIALSDAAVAEIRNFGGLVLADLPPGAFDEHSRRRAALPLNDKTTLMSGLSRGEIGSRLAPASLFTLDPEEGRDVSLWHFRDGAKTLLALQHDWTGTGGTVTLRSRAPMLVRDLRAGGPAMQVTQMTVRLDPAVPTLLEVSPVH
jgi:hypothetical protein